MRCTSIGRANRIRKFESLSLLEVVFVFIPHYYNYITALIPQSHYYQHGLTKRQTFLTKLCLSNPKAVTSFCLLDINNCLTIDINLSRKLCIHGHEVTADQCTSLSKVHPLISKATTQCSIFCPSSMSFRKVQVTQITTLCKWQRAKGGRLMS